MLWSTGYCAAKSSSCVVKGKSGTQSCSLTQGWATPGTPSFAVFCEGWECKLLVPPCPPASNGVPASFARGVFKRYQQSKHFHFITFSCYKRQPFLQTAAAKDTVLQILEQNWQVSERSLSRLRILADCVEAGGDFRRQLYRCGVEILTKMLGRRCPGDQQDVGRALKKPRKRNLHWRALE